MPRPTTLPRLLDNVGSLNLFSVKVALEGHAPSTTPLTPQPISMLAHHAAAPTPSRRLSGDIGESNWRLLRAFGVTLPLLYLAMFLLRWLLIAAFVPLIHRLSKDGIHLSWKEIIFATMVRERLCASVSSCYCEGLNPLKPAPQPFSMRGNA